MKKHLGMKLVVATLVCFALSYGFEKAAGPSKDSSFPFSLAKKYAEKHRIEQLVETSKRFSMNGINAIDLSTVSADVTILPSTSGEVEVNLKGTAEVKLTAEQKGDAIYLKVEDPEHNGEQGFHFYMDAEEAEKLILKVPPGVKGFQVKTISGNVDLAEGFKFDHVHMDSVSGDLRLKRFESEKVWLQTVSGNQRITGLWNEFKAAAISGDFVVESENPSPEMNFSSTSGDVNLKFKSNPNLKLTFESLSGAVEISSDGKEKSHAEQKFVETLGKGKGALFVKTISGDFNLSY